jgi:hypothetical protein
MLHMDLDNHKEKLYRAATFFIASFFFGAPRP